MNNDFTNVSTTEYYFLQCKGATQDLWLSKLSPATATTVMSLHPADHTTTNFKLVNSVMKFRFIALQLIGHSVDVADVADVKFVFLKFLSCHVWYFL